MYSYEVLESLLLDYSVSKEKLFDDIVQWLPEDQLKEFLVDFMNDYDIDLGEE